MFCFKFLDNSSIATGKPTACYLLKSKKTIKKVDKNPTFSAAFWYLFDNTLIIKITVPQFWI
jgi:hypothetical protein